MSDLQLRDAGLVSGSVVRCDNHGGAGRECEDPVGHGLIQTVPFGEPVGDDTLQLVLRVSEHSCKHFAHHGKRAQAALVEVCVT